MSVLIAAPAKACERQLAADISSNNPAFNAAHYASAGHLLITIKATQGVGYINPDWRSWTGAAHQDNLAVNHYHFADLAGGPVEQAQFFWSTIRPHFTPRLDRVMIDIETGPQQDWPRFLELYDKELHRLSGLETIGYTFASALRPALQLRSGLWMVASYGTVRPGNWRLELPCGTLWGWQYTGGTGSPSGGPTTASGIRGAVDLTVLRAATVRNLQHDINARRKVQG